MIPIAQAKSLPDGININPYDIYILLPQEEIDEKSVILNSIWEKHTFLNEIFKIKFISRESLLIGDDEKYYKKIFESSNIFARILMPKGTHIKIETSLIYIGENYINKTEEDLLIFIYQLCESNANEIKQMLIDTEFFLENSCEKNERLHFLALLDNNFKRLKDYLKYVLKGNERYRLRKNRYRPSKSGRDSEGKPSYLNNDINEFLQRIHNEIYNSEDIWILAESLGFSVPAKSKDSETIIELTTENERMRYPAIKITKDNKIAKTSRSYKEGIFIYACTLLHHLKDKPFDKLDFYKFLKEIWPFKDKENEIFLDNSMPDPLRQQYDWYFKVYRVLNYWKPQFTYRDIIIKKNFYNWLIKLGDDVIRNERGDYRKDAIDQGVANIRTSILSSLSEKKLDYLNENVNLTCKKIERRSSYRINAKKENLIFPDHKIWEELAGKSHLKSYWKSKGMVSE